MTVHILTWEKGERTFVTTSFLRAQAICEWLLRNGETVTLESPVAVRWGH